MPGQGNMRKYGVGQRGSLGKLVEMRRTCEGICEKKTIKTQGAGWDHWLGVGHCMEILLEPEAGGVTRKTE